MTLPARRLLLCLTALALSTACLRKEPRRKPPTRTEPWPAPLVSAAPVGSAGRARYNVEGGQIEIEISHRKRVERARVSEVSGTIELDPVQLTNTRAELRVDLLNLAFTRAGEDAPDLTLRALEVLGLANQRDPASRELDRYAILNINGIDRVRADANERATKTPVTARGELTLHHFRVPVTLELEVEFDKKSQENPGSRLLIRTRKPLVVALAAHDLIPQALSKRTTPRETTATGPSSADFGREARVSAELSAYVEPLAKP